MSDVHHNERSVADAPKNVNKRTFYSVLFHNNFIFHLLHHDGGQKDS